MSKTMKQELVPELRFPNFKNTGAWRVIKLIDVADKSNKWSFIGGPFGSNLKSSDYVSEGVRIIQLQNIGDAEFKDDYQIFTSDEKADDLLSNNIYPGDIILSKMGDPVGRACLIPDTHSRYVMCSDGIRLVVDEREFSKYFIYILINSDWFRASVEASATGSTRKRIGLDVLKKLPLIVPKNIEEQQKIADCLSSLDELITAHTQKYEALQSYKKGLMQNLFPEEGKSVPALRFPEFEYAGEWEDGKFGEIVSFDSGGTPSKDRMEYWDGEIPWISAASMHDIGIGNSDRYITKLAVEDGARLASKGTLLLLVRGSMLHKRIPVGIAEREVAFNQDVKALRLKKPILEKFLLYLLIASELRLLGAVTKTGIGAGKLDTADLKDFRFSIPNKTEEQQKIAECLSSVDDLITAQAKKIEELKAHKKGLMQQLFPTMDKVTA